MPIWLSELRANIEALSDTAKRRLVTGGFILVQLIIWTAVFELFWYGNRSITDTPIYFDYAGRMAEGLFPYSDFASEYPPVAMLLFSLPRILSGTSYGAFVFWFEAEMFFFGAGIIILISTLAWRQWRDLKKVAAAQALYIFFLLALGAIVKSRFDLAVAFIILASLASFVTDRRLLAWILIGAGLMTKGVPLLIAPLFLISHYRRRQWREMFTGPVAAAVTAGIIAVPFLVASASGLAESFLYHAERPLQLESSWASPLLLLSSFGELDLNIMNSYGSHNVFSPGAELAAALSGPVTAALLATGYLLYLRSSSGELTAPVWQAQITGFAAAVIATFIVGGKVLSPQYFIWLLPLVPLVAGRGRRATIVLFTAVLLLTQWEFPSRYWNLFMLERDVIIVVAVRNLMLAGLVVSLVLSSILGREKSGR